MIKDSYIRKAKVIRVIDGDTIEVMIDNGYKRYSIERIRLNRVNAPELKGESYLFGKQSKDYVCSLLRQDDDIYVESYKGDSFGRWIGEVYFIKDGLQENLSDLLLTLGFATPYVK